MYLSEAEQQQMDQAISCPAPRSVAKLPMLARQLIYELWVALLCRYLPDPALVDLLVDWQQISFGSIWHRAGDFDDPERDAELVGVPVSEDLGLVDTMEWKSAVHGLRGTRRKFACNASVTESGGDVRSFASRSLSGLWLDDEFERKASWHWELDVVRAGTRAKHWPPPSVRTAAQLREHSLKHQGPAEFPGWLNPGTDPAKLVQYAQACLAEYFYRTLEQRTVEMPTERAADFLTVWSELFNNGTFRLGVEHDQVMGAQLGSDCYFMVYDFDPGSKQFHCFPVKSFPNVSCIVPESLLEVRS
jgi:hypothetical protein